MPNCLLRPACCYAATSRLPLGVDRRQCSLAPALEGVMICPKVAPEAERWQGRSGPLDSPGQGRSGPPDSPGTGLSPPRGVLFGCRVIDCGTVLVWNTQGPTGPLGVLFSSYGYLRVRSSYTNLTCVELYRRRKELFRPCCGEATLRQHIWCTYRDTFASGSRLCFRVKVFICNGTRPASTASTPDLEIERDGSFGLAPVHP